LGGKIKGKIKFLGVKKRRGGGKRNLHDAVVLLAKTHVVVNVTVTFMLQNCYIDPSTLLSGSPS
jgi:hypothetical protein